MAVAFRTEKNWLQRSPITASSNLPVMYAPNNLSHSDATYYLEAVGKVTSGTGTLTYTQSGGSTTTITWTETSYTRKRVSLNKSGNGDYGITTFTGTGLTVSSVRVVTLQSKADGSIKSLINWAIGNYETGKTNTTASPLVQPKYFTYTAANYTPAPTLLTAYVNARIASNMYTFSCFVQEDNGSFGGWTNIATLASGYTFAANNIYELFIVDFTPTDGRHYRIAAFISSNMTSYDMAESYVEVYVDGTGATPISEIESESLLLNTGDLGTGLQTRQSLYDTAEWDTGASGSLTVKHSMDSDNASNSAKLTQIPSTDVTSSAVTGANQQISAALSPTNSSEIDTNVTNTTGIIAASRIVYIYNYVAAASRVPRSPGTIGHPFNF